MIIVGEQDERGSVGREVLVALPKDLRERVRRRLMTIDQAQAWARLRAAFDGDVEALRDTLLAAFPAA